MPKLGWVKINIDGSMSTSRQRAAIGGVLRGPSRGWLVGFEMVTSMAGIFQIEAQAILEGFKLAWMKGFKQVEVESNNALLIDTIRNNFVANSNKLILELVFHHPRFCARARIKAAVAMVKFLKPNKAVIVLQGRYAGRKAVIYPSKVIRKDSGKKTAKKSRVKCFVKLVNYQHLMPTGYTLDVDLKDIVPVDALQTKDKKVATCKTIKGGLEEVQNRKKEVVLYQA
ncbi:hypothetical protein J1N35_012138 [Gossypium stocksii]|uniref:RNase H type-1 domain-containing protein n=1 Tax=Gossypium stocksii TaxID=47602 RepID=A0A9D3W5S1_9ROSI|nr:hypothetical protein J1N35_012138 [Gossypium stocksii]